MEQGTFSMHDDIEKDIDFVNDIICEILCDEKVNRPIENILKGREFNTIVTSSIP
jgi:hypothetical protein